jgi:glycosyltransferase involved in cell wall biosynthesis
MDLYRRIKKSKPDYIWSICVLTLKQRHEDIGRLVQELDQQTRGRAVQVLWLGDNKSMSVGEKRNLLWSIAAGKYLSFFDDDDWPDSMYVEKVLQAIEQRPDVVTFQVLKKHNGKNHRVHRYAKRYGMNILDPDRTRPIRFYNMLPDHLCVWNRDIVYDGDKMRVPFPDQNLREDHIWAQGMLDHYSNAVDIPEALYIYDYQTDKSETHQSR